MSKFRVGDWLKIKPELYDFEIVLKICEITDEGKYKVMFLKNSYKPSSVSNEIDDYEYSASQIDHGFIIAPEYMPPLWRVMHNCKVQND